MKIRPSSLAVLTKTKLPSTAETALTLSVRAEQLAHSGARSGLAPDAARLLLDVERYAVRFDQEASRLRPGPDDYFGFDRLRAHAERAFVLAKALWRAARSPMIPDTACGRYDQLSRDFLARGEALTRETERRLRHHPDFDNGEAEALRRRGDFLERRVPPHSFGSQQ
jgi:hypothetical protein